MHSVIFVIAAAGTVALLILVSVAVANVAASMYDERLSASEAARRLAMTVAWDGVERRTGVDRRWQQRVAIGAVVTDGRGEDRRIGGRRLTDVEAPAARRAA